MEGQGVEYNQYSLKFSQCYENAMLQTLNEIKNFCVQMATAYSIIHLEQTDSIPRIKAVVYSPSSDTYYVHTNDLEFLNYLLPRLQKFFLTPQFEFENFKNCMSAMMRIAFECEALNHHPDWSNVYKALHHVPRLFALFVCKQVMDIAGTNSRLSKHEPSRSPLCPSCLDCIETCGHVLTCEQEEREKCF